MYAIRSYYGKKKRRYRRRRVTVVRRFQQSLRAFTFTSRIVLQRVGDQRALRQGQPMATAIQSPFRRRCQPPVEASEDQAASLHAGDGRLAQQACLQPLEPVGELWFHLYLNAFRNSESTFV